MYVLKQAVNMKLSFNFFTSRESPKSHSLYFESLYKMDKFLGHTIGMKKYVYIHNFVMQGLVFIAYYIKMDQNSWTCSIRDAVQPIEACPAFVNNISCRHNVHLFQIQ